jgi:FKBP-type peptidyl-prolyl cis-trans isomerase
MSDKKSRYILLFTVCLAVLFACKRQPQEPSNRPVADEDQQALIKLNSGIVEVEDDSIAHYVAKKRLAMTRDSLGYWFSTDSTGSGARPASGDRVVYRYSISLLDGTLCYSNLNTSKLASIELGKGKLFSGFEMALRKMTAGSNAGFVFPSYLGYGVSGDGYKIPPYSPLVCTIHLLQIEKGHRTSAVHK